MKMQTKSLILTAALLFASIVSRSQISVVVPADLDKGTACDTVRYLVLYDFKFVKDTLNTPYKYMSEPMRLEVGDSICSFVSQKTCDADSINAVKAAQGQSGMIVTGQITWRLYFNYPQEGKLSTLERFGMDRYVCTEDIAIPQWTLVPDSSSTVLGYTCHLATTEFKGRKWSAWYSEEIPIDNGPWQLSGLPGLILKAYDSENQFVFEANGMTKDISKTPVYYKGTKYESIGKAELMKLYRRYYADPIGYITDNPNVTVKVQDEKGNPVANPKAVPYNLLERENR